MRFIRQVVLPLLIVLALVAGVSFVAQYVGRPAPPSTRGGEALRFDATRAAWDAGDPDYVAEVEAGREGHYDFRFRNPSPEPVEVTLRSASPGVQVEIGGQPLRMDETRPAPAEGMIRLRWQLEKIGPATVNAELGLRRAGQDSRQRLEVPIRIVPAVQVQPARVDIGDLPQDGARTADFTVWSTSRDAFELRVDQPRPCFQIDWRPLDEQERRELAERRHTRPRNGYALVIRVTDRAGAEVLDLGPFVQPLRLSVVGSDEPVLLEVAGVVRGSGRILSPGAKDRLDLGSFPRARGTGQTLVLGLQPPAEELKLVSSPDAVQVTLTPRPAELGAARWQLTATVPPHRLTGALPADSAIVLEIAGPQLRRWRIPVAGRGTQ